MVRVFFYILFFGIGMVVVSKPGLAVEKVCLVETVEAMKSCLIELKAGTVEAIEITKQIICENSAMCQFKVSGVTGGKIYGTPGTNAGFWRKNSFTQPGLQIIDSSNITISNLTFDDDLSSPGCVWVSWAEPTSCQPQILISRSTDIVMTQLKLLNSKSQAIEVRGTGVSRNIVLKNSTVSNTYEQGIIVHPADVDTVLIEGNIFTKTGGAAAPVAGKNITIKNNSMSQSQWKTPWKIGGGQINVHGVEGGLISGNNIFNGIAFNESPKEFITGIEFSENSSDIVIVNNNIVDNTAAGINNGFTYSLDRIRIINNRIVGNGSNWRRFSFKSIPETWDGTIYDLSEGLAKWITANNCNKRSCELPIANGSIDIAPNPCYIKPGKTTCSVSVSWLSNFATGVKIKKGAVEIARGLQGTKVIEGISSRSELITVVDENNKILAAKRVAGIDMGGTMGPTAGDSNDDAKIDLADFLIWKMESTGVLTTKRADFDNNEVVDLADFEIWKMEYLKN